MQIMFLGEKVRNNKDSLMRMHDWIRVFNRHQRSENISVCCAEFSSQCSIAYDYFLFRHGACFQFILSCELTPVSCYWNFKWKPCWMHNLGAPRQQHFYYVIFISSVNLDQSWRADLCRRKVSEWHICISKPITNTLWKPFGYPRFKN